MGSIHKELKERQRAERDSYPENLSLRVHRALSWLDRAEQDDDPDSRFIFLWIAFNAAYATEIDDRVHLNEQATFNGFLEKLCDLDGEKRIGELVWKAYPNAIRVLLVNCCPVTQQRLEDWQQPGSPTCRRPTVADADQRRLA